MQGYTSIEVTAENTKRDIERYVEKHVRELLGHFHSLKQEIPHIIRTLTSSANGMQFSLLFKKLKYIGSCVLRIKSH